MAKEEYKIEKEKLDALLEEVQGELNQILKSESAALAKAATDDEPAEESSGSADGAPADDIAPEASAPEASPEMSPEASPAAPEASAPEASPDMGAEGSAPPSLEELASAYAQLPPEQFELHAAAIQMVQQQMGGAPGAGPEASAPAGAPPAAPPAAPPMAPEASAPMAPPAMAPPQPEMGKAEKAAVVAAPKGNGGQIRKSEKDLEIEALKVQLADQGKALTQLVEALQAPIRKSVKGISEVQYIGKDGGAGRKASELSKTEVTKLLREKARDASLSKSDRALIVAYTTGRVSVEKLEHLLASAK